MEIGSNNHKFGEARSQLDRFRIRQRIQCYVGGVERKEKNCVEFHREDLYRLINENDRQTGLRWKMGRWNLE